MGQDHHAVGYDQASLSFICWEQIWWPSPNRHALILLRYRLSQTKKCRSPYSKCSSYSAPAFGRLLSLRSTIRLHTEEYSRVTYFVLHFFRLGSSFLLVNALFARVILDLNFFLTGSVRLIRLPRWLKCDSWLNCLPTRKIVNSSPVLLLIFITLVFITLVSIPYWWFSLSHHLKKKLIQRV